MTFEQKLELEIAKMRAFLSIYTMAFEPLPERRELHPEAPPVKEEQ